MDVTYRSNFPELGKAILLYAEVQTKKDLPEILEDQANKLACSDFGEGAQGLYQESAKTAPSQAMLLDLPAQRNYRIKHPGRPLLTQFEQRAFKRGKKKGQVRAVQVGVEGEMNRRARHRFYQAAGWLSARLSKYARGRNRGQDRAQVTLQLTGTSLYVLIANNSPAAGEVADRTGYLARAVNARVADLMAYVTRKITESAQAFNRQRLGRPR